MPSPLVLIAIHSDMKITYAQFNLLYKGQNLRTPLYQTE